MPLAWGAKVSPAFRDKVKAVAESISVDPNWLMACMAFESGETFNPSVRNAAGSNAVGLIQFMPHTAERLGTSSDALSKMTAEEQLDYVAAYFRPFRGKLKNLGDTYMAILWPRAIGKPDSEVLFDEIETATAYEQNKGLDTDKDGKVTKLEAYSRVHKLLDRGLLSINRSDDPTPIAKPLPVIGPSPIVIGSAPVVALAAHHFPVIIPIALAIAGAFLVTATVYVFVLSSRHHKDRIMTVSPEFQADLDAIAKAVTDIAAHEAGEGSTAALQAQLDAANAALAQANTDKADTVAALNAQVTALESQVAALTAPPAAPAA